MSDVDDLLDRAIVKVESMVEHFHRAVDYRRRMLHRYGYEHTNIVEANKLIIQTVQDLRKSLESNEFDAKDELMEESDLGGYDTALKDLSPELSSRIISTLRNRNIWSVGQVLTLSKEQLLAIRNMGPRGMHELEEVLIQNGYKIPWVRDQAVISAPYLRSMLAFGFSNDTLPDSLEDVLCNYYGNEWRNIQITGLDVTLGEDIDKENGWFISYLCKEVSRFMEARNQDAPLRYATNMNRIIELTERFSNEELEQFFKKLGVLSS